MKFKVGDKVKAVKDIFGHRSDSFEIGKIYTIKNYDGTTRPYKIDTNVYCYEDELELVERNDSCEYEPYNIIDNVNHPNHYKQGNFEPIDVINDWKLNFNLGNTIKYIARAKYKGKELEDLKKALFYLQDEINRQEKIYK